MASKRSAQAPDALEAAVRSLLAALGQKPAGGMEATPARVHIDETRKLGEARNFSRRQIGDVALAEERNQVVLAHRVEVYAAHDHHTVVLRFKCSFGEHLFGTGRVA